MAQRHVGASSVLRKRKCGHAQAKAGISEPAMADSSAACQDANMPSTAFLGFWNRLLLLRT